MTTTKSYPLFQPNQLLTSGQLNQVVSYLEGEGRASRTLINGIGILSGLEVSYEPSSDPQLEYAVVLSAGVGITSDGDLVHIKQDMTFMCARTVADCVDFPKSYAPFQPIMSSTWELLTSKDGVGACTSIGDLKKNHEDLVAILFVDKSEVAARSCADASCDAQGKRQQARVRLLAVPATSLAAKSATDKMLLSLADKDPFCYFRGGTEFGSLPFISPPNFSLWPGVDASTLRERFNDTFSAVAAASGPCPTRTILSAIRRYRLLFRIAIPDSDAYRNGTWVEAALHTGSATADLHNLQHAYEWILEIIAAYNEFLHALFHVTPDTSSVKSSFQPDSGFPFSRHLLLGILETSADSSLSDISSSMFRFPFLASGEPEAWLRARSRLMRLVRILGTFEVPRTSAVQVSVRRDAGPDAPLEAREIPSHYSERAADSALGRVWSFEPSRSTLAASRSTLVVGWPEFPEATHFRIDGLLGCKTDEAMNWMAIPMPFLVVCVTLDDQPIKFLGRQSWTARDFFIRYWGGMVTSCVPAGGTLVVISSQGLVCAYGSLPYRCHDLAVGPLNVHDLFQSVEVARGNVGNGSWITIRCPVLEAGYLLLVDYLPKDSTVEVRQGYRSLHVRVNSVDDHWTVTSTAVSKPTYSLALIAFDIVTNSTLFIWSRTRDYVTRGTGDDE